MQPQEPNNQAPQNHSPNATPSIEEPYSTPFPSPAPHSVGQVFTPGGSTSPQPSQDPNKSMPEAWPSQNTNTSMAADSINPQQLVSASSMQPTANEKRKTRLSKKLALLVGAPLLLIGGGGSAAYFGYYVPNKPENVWRTALTNTGKGYDKLSEYATSKKGFSGISAKGAFKISGDLAADGVFNGMSDGKNGQLTGSVSAAGLKVNYDVRSLESPGNSSDIYFKIDGVQSLGDLVGGYAGLLGGDSIAVTKALNGINGQWYFVDHTLFDQFAQGSNESLKISSSDVSGALKAVGDSSKQYLFTNDTEKMAIVVKQNVGKEKQDGRNVYHYKVGVNKNNLDSYKKSLCSNLIKTKLFKLFSQNSAGDQDFSQECYDNTLFKDVDTSATADAWVDLHTKLIHKIRFSEKGNSNNYFDIVQDYQGGDEFPFSLGFHSQDDVDKTIETQAKSQPNTESGLIKMKLNMKTNTFTADATFESTGSSKDKATFNLAIAPTSEKAKTEKPAGSKTIIELFNDLGFGDLVSTTEGGAQSRAKDTERRTDINALASQLEAYYSDNGYYPTLANLNDANWRKTNMKSLDEEALKDPDGTQVKLISTAAVNAYAYQPGPVNCSGSSCSSYTLTYTLGSGEKATKQSLN